MKTNINPKTTVTDRQQAADWEFLVAQHQEALQSEDACGDEFTRADKVLGDVRFDKAQKGMKATLDANDLDEIQTAAIAAASAERAYTQASTRSDALMLQIMATPAPHADALRYKTDLLRGEEYEYLGYAVDGLFDVYAADVLYFAGIGERASRNVLNDFVAELPEFFAERDQRADVQFEKATAAALADTAEAQKDLEAASRKEEVEAQLGEWLDAVDAGGGRLWDDDPAHGIYLVWASTTLKQPPWNLPQSKLDEIREQRDRAGLLTDRVRELFPLPDFVARMRKWQAFRTLNNQLEIERHEMTMRALRVAREHGLEEMVLRPRV